MRLHRLPIAVAPAQQETVASYLARLTSLHGLPLRELWEPISVPRPRSRRRDVLADRLAAVTGHHREHLIRALPELHPTPDWSALRHQPQPGCTRCDARHPGRTTATSAPATATGSGRRTSISGPLPCAASTISSVRSDTTCVCCAATARPRLTTLC